MDPKDEVQVPGGQKPPGQPPDQDDDFGTVQDPIEAPTRRVDKIALRQEGMRGAIAMTLLGLLAIALVWSLSTADTWTEMSELLEVWLPALTGLLGSAVGFYFGTRS
jgi:hypothetical protein